MSLNKQQFQRVIEQTLEEFDPVLLSPRAVDQELGTAAVESDFGTHFRQIGGGPGRGFFSMEPGTFASLQNSFGAKYPQIKEWKFEDQETNVRQMIVMARLKYRENSEPLPAVGDIAAQARYWKKWFNTPLGDGTEEKYKEKYRRYVA